MPVVIAALLGGLLQFAGSMVGRVLIALGMSYVTYRGLNTLLTLALTDIKNAIGGLGGAAAGLIGMLWIDKALTMYFSSVVAATVIKGWSGSGIASRLNVKAPGA